jgi:hypothetical protein
MKTDIAHSQDTINADAVEGYLRQNNVGVLVKDGGI